MKLPTDLSGQQLRRALERVGFVCQRQNGSHMILRRDDPHARVVVPGSQDAAPWNFAADFERSRKQY